MARHELGDEEWAEISHLLPTRARTGRPPRDSRVMLNALLWILRSGSPWRDLPRERFGPWTAAYARFRQWRESGLLDQIFEHVLGRLDEDGLLDRELWCIDGSVIRASRAAAGASQGGRRAC